MEKSFSRWSKVEYTYDSSNEDEEDDVDDGRYVYDDELVVQEDDDEEENDTDSREESESHHIEISNLSKYRCPRCNKKIKMKTNTMSKAICNKSNSGYNKKGNNKNDNNKNDNNKNDNNKNGNNNNGNSNNGNNNNGNNNNGNNNNGNNNNDDVSDKDIDSIEDSPIQYSIVKGERELSKGMDEGLMFFQHYNKLDSKNAMQEGNYNNHNNNNTSASSGKFVKTKEHGLKDGKNIQHFVEKRPVTRGQVGKIEKEMERLEGSRSKDQAEKENAKQLRMTQQFNHQHLQQEQEMREKQAMKLSHLQRLSRMASDNKDKSEMCYGGDGEKMGMGESDCQKIVSTFLSTHNNTSLFPGSPLCQATQSISNEIVLKRHSEDDEEEDGKERKSLADSVYKELKRKISYFSTNQHGDVMQKQPSNPAPTPNLSPAPSDNGYTFTNQHNLSKDAFANSSNPSSFVIYRQYDTDSRYSLYGLSSKKNVIFAFFFVLLCALCIVDLCPETVTR